MAQGEATRKLTTIVVADVVGYSRLMGDDGEGIPAPNTERPPVVGVESAISVAHKLPGPLFSASVLSNPNLKRAKSPHLPIDFLIVTATARTKSTTKCRLR